MLKVLIRDQCLEAHPQLYCSYLLYTHQMSDKYVCTASNIYERPFDLLPILPTTPSHLYFIPTVSSDF